MAQSLSDYKKSLKHYFYDPHFAITALFILVMAVDAIGQDYSVSPDRPAQTDGLTILAPGYIQLEVGLGAGNSSGDFAETRSLFLPNLLLRFGTSEKTEMHVIYDFLNLKTDTNTESGTSYLHQIGFGSKYHLLDENGLIPTAIFVGNVYYTSAKAKGGEPITDWDVEFKIVFQNNITDKLSLAYLIRYRNNFAFTINPSYALNNKLGIFLEYYSDIRFNSPIDSSNGVNGGFGYSINDRIAVDLLAGTLFINDFSNFYISSGVAWWIK